MWSFVIWFILGATFHFTIHKYVLRSRINELYDIYVRPLRSSLTITPHVFYHFTPIPPIYWLLGVKFQRTIIKTHNDVMISYLFANVFALANQTRICFVWAYIFVINILSIATTSGSPRSVFFDHSISTHSRLRIRRMTADCMCVYLFMSTFISFI